MAISLPQALAPAFATSLFAYSLASPLAGGHLVWVVMTTMCEWRPFLFLGCVGS
jgi:hypothetical protein